MNIKLAEKLQRETANEEFSGKEKLNVSCRVSNSILKYLESINCETSSILEGIPLSKKYLTDPLNWMPCSIRHELEYRASQLVGDEKIMYKVGLNTPKFNSISGIEHMVKLLGSPKLAYKKVPAYSKLFDKKANFNVEIVNDHSAIVTMHVAEEDRFSKHHCYYTQGILAAIPTLWGMPQAKVIEKQCIYDTNSVNFNGDNNTQKCEYEITWQPGIPLGSRIANRFFRVSYEDKAVLKKLENNFQLLDHKNDELLKRNDQLSKIREIALGIDQAETIDEVFQLVVEKARDINGIRFVLINKIDEEQGVVRTPYYSRIRGENIIRTLKSIGFDPDKQLGKNPLDKKLIFSLDKFKIAKDFQDNPRVISSGKLSEILKGVWPKVLCDSIQRLLSIKRFVLVPIYIDQKLWASMFFFLEDEVPDDLLEMIGAHCAIAVKNVGMLESIKLRNKELSAINSIVSKASNSLEIQKILDETSAELANIFNADASAIYILNEDNNKLELRAHTGIPLEMVKISKGIPLDSNIIKDILQHQDEVFSGNHLNYSEDYPDHLNLTKAQKAIPFIAATIRIEQQICGLITIVRNNEINFSSEEKNIFKSVSDQICISVENARLHNEAVETKNKLKLTIQAVSEGITVTDLNGVIQQANISTAKMHGYQSSEELIGLNSLDFIAIKDRDKAIQGIENTLKYGSSGLIEYTFIKKDGTEFPAELSANLIKDNKGNSIGFVASTRDITNRRKDEETLRESERRYRIITDATTDFISILNFKGTYKYVSPSHKKLGYDPEELIGKSGFDYIHPDDKKNLLPLLSKYTSYTIRDLLGLKEKSHAEEIDFRFKDKSGGWHYIEGIANLVDDPSGKGINILLTCRDMTERKLAENRLRESEEKYRMIFESVNDIIILLDKKGVIKDVNGKIGDIGGYNPQEIIGQNFKTLLKVMPKKSIAIIAKNFMKRMRARSRIWSGARWEP